MINLSNQTYKELSIPYFKETFEIIDLIFKNLQIPYYLIGVNAISLELLKNGIKPSRGTKDIDFAIMISSMCVYEQITDSLKDYGFNKVDAPYTFYSEKYKVVLDLLPYGKIYQENTESFNNRKVDLHVLGFNEVLDDSVKIDIEDKFVNIPPLEGMIILKLIAWSDRPEDRDNDLADILIVINQYFSVNFDEIVEKHNDIFPEGNLNQVLIAAEVLGRKSKRYLDKSNVIKERIMTILNNNLNKEEVSIIAQKWAVQNDSTIDQAKEILFAFYRGIRG